MSAKRERVLTVWLLGLDAALLSIAFALSWLVRFQGVSPPSIYPPDLTDLPVIYVAIAVWLGAFAMHGLYRHENLWSGPGEYARIANAATTSFVAVAVLSFLLGGPPIVSRGWLIVGWISGIITVAAGRFWIRRVVGGQRQRGRFLRRAFVVGANEQGIEIARQLIGFPSVGVRVVGFVDEFMAPGTPLVEGLTVVGGPMHLKALVAAHDVDELIVVPQAISWESMQELARLSAIDDGRYVSMYLATGWYDLLASGVRAVRRGNVPLLAPEPRRITGMDALFKGALDYALALALACTVLPIVLLWRLLSRPAGTPLLEKVPVIGRRGRRVEVWVLGGTARPGQLPLGIARLPAILNVLRRQLSLVGPRPLPLSAQGSQDWAPMLLSVRPGLIGLLPLGASLENQELRANLDLWYVRNYSIWLDLQALFACLMHHLAGRGSERREPSMTTSRQRRRGAPGA